MTKFITLFVFLFLCSSLAFAHDRHNHHNNHNHDDTCDHDNQGSEYEDICEDYECPQGYRCVPEVVQCIRAPCPPLPSCEQIFCPLHYKPVCGEDGNTYSNDCFLNAAGVEKDYKGECTSDESDNSNDDSEQTFCPLIYAPVCGEDGNTYPNECFLESADVELDHKGECNPTGVVCTQDYTPVCGKDGNTYSNDCTRTAAGVELDYVGECNNHQGVICTQDYTPVCGKDGNTYSNDCFRKAAGVEKDSDGTCDNGEEPVICPAIYAPVCGKDGKTYSNECLLGAAGVEKSRDGKCTDQVFCTLIYSPVCGKDGKTYSNGCFLNGAGVEKDHDGECTGDSDQTICALIYSPVCGKDGNTYSNECLLGAAGVEKDHNGKCKREGNDHEHEHPNGVRCTLEYAPVCGADGNTYSNECFRGAAGVEKAHNGECGKDE